MDNLCIGLRIKARRKQLNLTLDDIASEIGVAKSTVQRYEKGTIEKVKLPVIEAIARVLRVDPAWICCKTDIMTEITPTPDTGGGLSTEAKEVAHAYDQATEKEQRTVRLVLSDYLPDGTAPKEIAASKAPKELSREDVAQVIHPETSAELP